MKKFVMPALFWLFLLPGSSGAEPVTDFSAKLIDGGVFSLSEYRGDKAILLKFWATWCRTCLKQMPDYRKLHEKYGERVQFLSVNVAVNDPLEKVRAAVREHRLTMPVTYDEEGTLWNQFGIMGTPMYALIDNRGEIIFRGYHHDENLELALEGLPGERKQITFNLPKYLVDVTGNPLQVETGRDETLVAYHFATWCESYLQETDAERVRKCREFRTGIERLSQLANIRLVGFATRYSSDKESVLRYRRQHRIDHPLVFDESGTFAEQFGVRDFPHLVVLRNNSVVRHRDHIDAALIEQLNQ